MGECVIGARGMEQSPSRASTGVFDAAEDSSRLTKPDESPRDEESTWLPPIASAGTEGSSPELTGSLESPVTLFPHLKTLLEPDGSGPGKDDVVEGGEEGEADEEIRAAGGVLCATSP